MERKIRTYETRSLEGWTVQIQEHLKEQDPATLKQAIALLQSQLKTVRRVVPRKPLRELQKVTLWVSAEYPGTPPRAEYHPDAGWLRENGRDPQMVQGVEFTNVRLFAAETRRMPIFVLHELAHAYHHRVLKYDQPELLAAYERAKTSGTYDKVERRDSEGRTRVERAYALTSVQEYFAEGTEAFFGKNDFFPYDRAQLKKHDPEFDALLDRLWKGENR
jgi:hypothetical protein